MSDTLSSTEPKPTSGRRRIAYALVTLAAIAVLALVARWQIDKSKTKNELAALEAQLDEDDPNWRLADLENARAKVDDMANSALLAVEISKAVGRWPDHKFDERFTGQQPNELLDAERADLLDAEMKKLTFLPRARMLAEMKRGRHRLVWPDIWFVMSLEDQQECRKVAALLNYDSMDLAQKGKIDDALRSARACINVGRSLLDEPLLISQLIRIAIVTIGSHAVERTLARGEASDAELARVQELLADEAEHKTMHAAVRGERAASYDAVVKLASGKDPRALSGIMSPPGTPKPWYEQFLFIGGVSRHEPLHTLRIMTKAVESAKLPDHEQADAEQKIEREAAALGWDARLTKMIVPALTKVGEASRRKTASARSLTALVAVERYRLKNGKWPDTLEELKPDLLKEVPVDPHDGKPIRYKKLTEGVVVYSVGKDGIDDGGKIDRNRTNVPGTDLGYWLWDVQARRQPGKPKAKEPE